MAIGMTNLITNIRTAALTPGHSLSGFRGVELSESISASLFRPEGLYDVDPRRSRSRHQRRDDGGADQHRRGAQHGHRARQLHRPNVMFSSPRPSALWRM